jgi:hypothetical protein
MNRTNLLSRAEGSRVRAGIFVSALLVSLLAAFPSIAQLKTHPAVEVLQPNYSFQKTLVSLREFDPKNNEVVFFGGKGSRDFHVHLRNGNYEKHYRVGGDNVGLEWIKYIGSDGSAPDYAVAYYTWIAWVASSSDFGVVQLMRIEGGRLHVDQQILFNLRGSEKAGAYFNAKSNTLTIRGVNEWEHCCPTGLDVVRFQLKDGVLKQIHYGTAPLE